MKKKTTKLTSKVYPKDSKEVLADWKDTSDLIDGFVKALKAFGVNTYPHPFYDGTDMYGFIVTKSKLSRKQLNDIHKYENQLLEEEDED